MGSWGTELWDKWSAVVATVGESTTEMASFYAKFLAERAQVV
jgi:hypothetical protein